MSDDVLNTEVRIKIEIKMKVVKSSLVDSLDS